MTDYDSMSVHDLMGRVNVMCGGEEDPNDIDFLTIESAIRTAVIREASVGMVSTYTTLDGPEENEYIKTDWTIKGNYPEDGTFSLVPVVEAGDD